MSDANPTEPMPGLTDRLVAASGDAIIVADPDGRIILWNAGSETMFGYSADEAVGQTLDLIIPERLRARHWDGYRQTMRTGSTRYADDLLAVPGMRHDGTRVSLEFRVTLLADRDGRPEAIAAVLRDVTERWETERQLRRAGPAPRSGTSRRAARSGRHARPGTMMTLATPPSDPRRRPLGAPTSVTEEQHGHPHRVHP